MRIFVFILRAQLQTHFLTEKCIFEPTLYSANLTLLVKVFPDPDYCKETIGSTPVKNFLPVPIVQGVRGQSGVFNLALRERNIQVRLYLKVVLKS